MELWRATWRMGVEPLLSTSALEALRKALVTDDPRLIQDSTTKPPALAAALDWPVEGACAIGLCGWLGEGLQTVGEVMEFFCSMCCHIDERMHEPAACRWFTNWFDETPREEMRPRLLSEVNLALAQREEISHPSFDDQVGPVS